MVSELQVVAIAAFLLWCLVSSLCGLVQHDRAGAATLVLRERGPAGWGPWRQVHFGLTGTNRRVLDAPDTSLDRAAVAGLLDTVLVQGRQPSSEVVQFAVVRPAPDREPFIVVYVSDPVTVAPTGCRALPSPVDCFQRERIY